VNWSGTVTFLSSLMKAYAWSTASWSQEVSIGVRIDVGTTEDNADPLAPNLIAQWPPDTRQATAAACSTASPARVIAPSATGVGAPGASVSGRSGTGHLGDQLYLHARSERNLRHAERAPRVRAVLAEDVREQLRRAVGDEVLLGEVGRAVHHYEELHDARDGVEITGRGVQRREEIDSDRACRQLPLLYVDAGAELPHPRRSVLLRDVTGEEDEPPAAHERHERRDGRRDRGELDGERLETLIDGHGRHLVSAITGRGCGRVTPGGSRRAAVSAIPPGNG